MSLLVKNKLINEINDKQKHNEDKKHHDIWL